ncbi:MAG: 3-hydroxyacyl-CoA dehydrogenase family protein [Flammeovirgaceae bacterium]
MNILVIGNEAQQSECALKFAGHAVARAANHREAIPMFSSTDIVFDFDITQAPEQISAYKSQSNLVAFLDVTTQTLAALTRKQNHQVAATLFGFCGMPTFLNRQLLEVTARNNEDKSKLEEVCARLGTDFSAVDDRVGLVTPRVIAMIINEAYFTVQEGTASREDIDLAMKLGTNYPFGPFAWCAKIGVGNVYELLDSLYVDTKDERYKICPLLKKEFLATTFRQSN